MIANQMAGDFKTSVKSEIVNDSSNKKAMVNFTQNKIISGSEVKVIKQVESCAIKKLDTSHINLVEFWRYKNIGVVKSARSLENKCLNKLMLISTENDSAENALAFRHAIIKLGYDTSISGIKDPLIMNMK